MVEKLSNKKDKYYYLGIESRLDYLVDINVDAIWLTPIYKSPMVDLGYDVSDYLQIDPIFGTLADFVDLSAACHERRMCVNIII